MADSLQLEDQSASAPGQEILSHVVNSLEEDIVLGRLHQRERLIEEDLMGRFGAKRHVIRQALVELERMGIVERIPNRGSSVRAYSAEIVLQLYDVRSVLETHAAKLIPLPLPKADLDRLKSIQHVHDKAVADVDFRMVFRSNIEFHRTLFGLCSNPFLAKSIEEYEHRTHGIRFYALADPGEHKRARDEHHQMIKALEEGDRERLVELCRRHLLPAKSIYIQAAKKHLA
ncbi:GntR family transcriptional regulator [Microvirga sp. KLBC 81]|uniref:GntR family transcriptional regulator n=1 Tax=Microvirga sp. KLBC 81 TaxID=1862707 RepID=UPI000D50E696|nr:GntR family transcriptional regulator [Microvirga sp. KLBC 81]PVE21217.1 GntR family transcriptional regulator [Microvirga sp. KLBC 81]